MKRTLIKIHKWTGLAFAILILMQALSGIIMVNKDWLQAYSSGFDSNEDKASLDSIITSIQKELPEHRIERIIYTNANSALLARAYPKGSQWFSVVYVDPITTAVLLARPFWQDPVQLAERIHVSLLAGSTGHWVLLIEGGALILMTVLGLIIWWPKPGKWKNSVKVNWAKGGLRRWRDLHISIGTIVSVFILITALSGFMLIAESSIKPVLSLFAATAPEPNYELEETDNTEPMITWQQSLDQLNSSFPNSSLRQLRIVGGDRVLGAIMAPNNTINPRDHHILGIDRYIDKKYVYQNANEMLLGDEILHWILPIHSGDIWGWIRLPLISFMGFSLITIVISGILMWLLKRKQKRLIRQ
jgi:uncharacterized iron-regulated membrane protein